jgi:alkylhydroperoxidase family enzyme
MARVPLVADDDEAALAGGIFDTFRDEGRDPSDIFRALANVPGLMMAHRALPRALRGQQNCPPRLRELAVLRLAQLVGSAYEWSHHRPMALHAGVTADQAAALAAWRESAAFGPAERLALAATEAVHEMAVTAELFSELEAELGRSGAIELIVVVSQYEAVARIIQALGVEVEPDHQHHLADWLPGGDRIVGVEATKPRGNCPD